MRDKKRIKPFMNELATIWERECPDWRFGQLIYNVLDVCREDKFFLEENETLEVFKNFFNKE